MKLFGQLLFTFFLGAVFSLVGLSLDVESTQAQSRRSYGGSSRLALIQKESVKSELNLSDRQTEEIAGINKKVEETANQLYAELRTLPRSELSKRMAEVRKLIERLKRDGEKQLDSILLKPQKSRLNQISARARLFKNGSSPAAELLDKEVAEKLELTTSQKNRLKKEIEKANEELAEEIAKLKKAKAEKIMKILSKDQRAAHKALLGDDFNLKTLYQFGRPKKTPEKKSD